MELNISDKKYINSVLIFLKEYNELLMQYDFMKTSYDRKEEIYSILLKIDDVSKTIKELDREKLQIAQNLISKVGINKSIELSI